MNKIVNKKTALVTGVSSGIGESICRELISKGYKVHGTYNSTEPIALKEEMRGKS